MAEQTEREQAQRLVAENRKALHDYHILETFEAGLVLQGTEVKSIREGRVNLRDSFARVESGEVWVYNIHISAYSHRVRQLCVGLGPGLCITRIYEREFFASFHSQLDFVNRHSRDFHRLHALPPFQFDPVNLNQITKSPPAPLQ